VDDEIEISTATSTRDLGMTEAVSKGTPREERKMSHRQRCLAICCALMITATAAATERRWTVTGQEVPELSAIDHVVRGQMLEFDIRAATVAIAKDGRLVFARGYTWDSDEAEPVQPTSLFRTGSIGKAITSIAIHQLIEDGLLSYDTPVASTLGLQPPAGQRPDPWLELVTVDHLLTHTVGWDKYDGGIDPMVFRDWQVALSLGVLPPPTRREIATFMTGQEFQFYPGTRWAYCNVGYLLLQMLAEKVTGQDFPEYVFDHVFRPVGVGRVRVGHTLPVDLAPTERDYTGDYEGDPYQFNAENVFAAGGMVMSAPDMARLFSVLFDSEDAGGLLERGTIEEMLALPFPASADMGYGRGWIHDHGPERRSGDLRPRRGRPRHAHHRRLALGRHRLRLVHQQGSPGERLRRVPRGRIVAGARPVGVGGHLHGRDRLRSCRVLDPGGGALGRSRRQCVAVRRRIAQPIPAHQPDPSAVSAWVLSV
jgi:CubicO group peptidase (beta-lactamase class C family)